uniref:NADP-dependent oxidoreductase domain-containing protein n=1 Tax=Clastoptera arizonana TaxID=38151 RepID=A0A1B6DZR4_9HEMI
MFTRSLSFLSQELVAKFSAQAIMNSVKLNSGYELPLLGLGTWQTKPEQTKVAVKTALKIGYRHIDTAPNYNNEKEIGEAINEWINDGGKREELFVTTKLPTYGNRPDDVCKYVNKSLANLKLDYIDLYLMHMPFSLCPDEKEMNPALGGDGRVILDKTNHIDIWKQMEAQVNRGVVKSLGVSNFNVIQLEKLFYGSVIHPSVIQVELHAYLQQPEMRYLAETLNIKVVAYSPLGSPAAKKHFAEKYGLQAEVADLLNDPVVVEIAKCKNKTPAQILLMFLLQQCIAVIPKSANPERIKENADVFDCYLNEEDMKKTHFLKQRTKGSYNKLPFLERCGRSS